jgi:hypothetical protein
MNTPPEHKPMCESLRDIPVVELPPQGKAQFMLGPEGSFDPAMPDISTTVAGAGALKAELVDIVSTWSQSAPATLGKIAVPVHYRQAEVVTASGSAGTPRSTASQGHCRSHRAWMRP